MAYSKFTFKTEKSTGKYASFFSDNHIIKLDKKQVGNIDDKFPHRIKLMIFKDDINEDGNPNCSWRWITLKKESKNVTEAKDFLRKYGNIIQAKFKIHKSED